jgi:hypothetical protein
MEKIITIRHMDDVNALREHGFNGPIKDGQEKLLASIVNKIKTEMKNKNSVRILYTSETRRIKETAEKIMSCFENKHLVIMEDDCRLNSIDRGKLILPEEYQDGDWFHPLDEAWEAVNDEMFLHKNIFCRFGDPLNGKYPKLADSFSEPGNSFGDSIVKKFSLILDLINRAENDELFLIVGQSDFPILLSELLLLSDEIEGVTPNNLPYIYWDRYKSSLPKEVAYDREGIDFGQVDFFNLSTLIKTKMVNIIKESKEVLINQKRKRK